MHDHIVSVHRFDTDHNVSQEALLKKSKKGKKALPSAITVLDTFELVAKVVLQDALELIDEFPDHVVYQMELFTSPEFQALYDSYHKEGGIREVCSAAITNAGLSASV